MMMTLSTNGSKVSTLSITVLALWLYWQLRVQASCKTKGYTNHCININNVKKVLNKRSKKIDPMNTDK